MDRADCWRTAELSRINLDDAVVPMLIKIPTDDKNYITWPNDTIAKAILAIVENEIFLARRVDWELVAIMCGRSTLD